MIDKTLMMMTNTQQLERDLRAACARAVSTDQGVAEARDLLANALGRNVSQARADAERARGHADNLDEMAENAQREAGQLELRAVKIEQAVEDFSSERKPWWSDRAT